MRIHRTNPTRYAYGETNPIRCPAASATIDTGDLCYLDLTGDAWSAHTLMIPATDSRNARRRFALRFLGVAQEKSRHGETSPIGFATTGVFVFPPVADERHVAMDAFTLGDRVAPALKVSGFYGPALRPDAVAHVESNEYAIGRVDRVPKPTDVGLYVDIRSAVMRGGIVDRAEIAALRTCIGHLAEEVRELKADKNHRDFVAEQLRRAAAAVYGPSPLSNAIAIIEDLDRWTRKNYDHFLDALHLYKPPSAP